MLPVRNMVLFPSTIIPLPIGREKSRRLVDSVLPDQKIIAVVCQKDPDLDDPGPEDLYTVGTATMILKLLRTEEDTPHHHHRPGAGRDRGVHRPRAVPAGENPRAPGGGPEDHGDRGAGGERPHASRGASSSCRPTSRKRPRSCSSSIESPGTLADFLASNLPLEFSRQAEPAGGTGRRAAPAQGDRGASAPGGRAGTEPQDPGPGAGQHRQEPARVLPPGAAQGHPEGTGPGRRAHRRGRAGQGQDRRRPACPRPSRPRPFGSCRGWRASRR